MSMLFVTCLALLLGPLAVCGAPSETNASFEFSDFCLEKSDGNYSYHGNCSHFYLCIAGITYKGKCPDGLLYNSLEDVCDWPENANCSVMPDSSTTTNVTTPEPDRTTSSNSFNTTQRIGSTTVEESNLCQEKLGGTNCSVDSSSPSTTKDVTTPKPAKTTSTTRFNTTQRMKDTTPKDKERFNLCRGKPDGNYVYSCVGETIYDGQCPDTNFYNSLGDFCDLPENVKCSAMTKAQSSSPSTLEVTTSKPEMTTESMIFTTSVSMTGRIVTDKQKANFCGGKPDGNYPNPENCTHFYSCVAGITFDRECPDSLFYNSQGDLCDWPQNVDCPTITTAPNLNSTPTSTEVTTPKTEKPTIPHKRFTTTAERLTSTAAIDKQQANFCDEKSDGNYPNLVNCTHFYSCVAELTYDRECPNGLFYNSQGDYCDWPENVHCPSELSSPLTTTQMRTSEHEKTAPNELFSTSQSTKEAFVTEKQQTNFCDGKADGDYPNPEKCTNFYSCVFGITYDRVCPSILFYNPIGGICDWPENVDC